VLTSLWFWIGWSASFKCLLVILGYLLMNPWRVGLDLWYLKLKVATYLWFSRGLLHHNWEKSQLTSALTKLALLDMPCLATLSSHACIIFGENFANCTWYLGVACELGALWLFSLWVNFVLSSLWLATHHCFFFSIFCALSEPNLGLCWITSFLVCLFCLIFIDRWILLACACFGCI